jgi:hypothetical protein
MKVVAVILFILWSYAATAAYNWLDCIQVNTCQYREANSGWKARTIPISFCYDTYAFKLTIGKKQWLTGIEGYKQHLENGILVEEFVSEQNKEQPGRFRFHIIRSKPAVITITEPGGATWLIRSAQLEKVELEKRRK